MATKKNKVAQGDSALLKRLKETWSDEAKAVAFIEDLRWGEHPYCPHCGSLGVYQMADKSGARSPRFLWRCKDCDKQYTVRFGMVMEDSRIPMRVWCFAFHAACASKKGISALQISRETGLSYKSALFLMHRIRLAMATMFPDVPLDGTVEVDETYVGGKPRYPQKREGRDRSVRMKTGRNTSRMPVVALVQRGGNVRAMPMARINAANLKAAIRAHVHYSARIITDDAKEYIGLDEEFASHESVNHSRREYARGDVTTNTVEGFFSLLKRGMYGTFHSVSKRHLHRYVSEFEFRWNNRHVDDGERTARAIRSALGRRMVYKAP